MSRIIASSLNDHGNRGNPRVMMWCVPRSVSTALTKCLSFVEGAEVWLEPYYVCKAADDVHHTFHPEDKFPLKFEGNAEVYKEAAINLTLGGNDFDREHLELLSPVTLKWTFDNLDPAKKFVFIKDLAQGMPPSRYPYLPDRSSGIKHLFLIRHPVKSYKSLRKILLNFFLTAGPGSQAPGTKAPDVDTFHIIKDVPTPREGTQYNYAAIHELWTHIRNTEDENPVILDIDDLLENPLAMLPRLFKALGIPYSANIPASPRYAMWFSNAFKSSCFKVSSTTASLDDATDDIKEVVEKEMPFYEEMYSQRITIDTL